MNSDLPPCQVESPKKSMSLTEKAKSAMTNIAYNLKNCSYVHVPLVTRKNIELTEGDYTAALLLGKSYNYNNREEFQRKFQSTIWMTYRENEGNGDVGWGCMIRVVQMVFAEVLQRYGKFSLTQIISFFREQSSGPFSLSKICKMGNIEKRYTSAPEIYSIITSLLEEKGKDIKLRLSAENFNHRIQIKRHSYYEKFQDTEFPKMISISCNIAKPASQNCIDQIYLSHMQGIFNDERFCGAVAGKANQALFVIGEYKGQAIILDPHYVQSSQTQETYFEQIPKGVDICSLRPSLSFNFYFEDLQSFGEWVDYVITLQKVFENSLCFEVQVDDAQNWTRSHRKKSEDFEIL